VRFYKITFDQGLVVSETNSKFVTEYPDPYISGAKTKPYHKSGYCLVKEGLFSFAVFRLDEYART